MSKIQTTYNKGSCIALEADDLTTVTRLVEDSLRRTKGKQAKYENSDRGLNLFMERATEFFSYINEVNGNPDLEKKLIPDIETLCCYLGITRKTLALYRKRNEQWEQAIDLVKDGIMACKKQLAQTHRMPPLIYIFDAVNNFGYHNATEFHLSTEPTEATQTPQIAESQLAEIATAVPELPRLPEDFSQD